MSLLRHDFYEADDKFDPAKSIYWFDVKKNQGLSGVVREYYEHKDEVIENLVIAYEVPSSGREVIMDRARKLLMQAGFKDAEVNGNGNASGFSITCRNITDESFEGILRALSQDARIEREMVYNILEPSDVNDIIDAETKRLSADVDADPGSPGFAPAP